VQAGRPAPQAHTFRGRGDPVPRCPPRSRPARWAFVETRGLCLGARVHGEGESEGACDEARCHEPMG
jgi:hypothetical protein